MSAELKQEFQTKIQMHVVKGPHAGQVLYFSKSILNLGRGPENDIVLVNDPLVSRSHARIEYNQGHFELINLSQKNGLLIQGDFVDKCRLINDSVFQIGDSEIKFQFDSGQSVVSVPTKQTSIQSQVIVGSKNQNSNINSVANLQKSVAQPNGLSLVKPLAAEDQVKNYTAAQNQQRSSKPHQFAQTGYARPVQSNDLREDKNKRIRFYCIISILLLGLGYFLLGPTVKNKGKKAKPILKYEDEITYNLKSEKETELRKKRESEKKAKESPQALRAEENFIKGMRDFQLGNYARAQDFFQVVLNLSPDHALARRHWYLAKVRFDEIVQAKLILGESYYQKHNFDMCQSMNKQVINMLQGKMNDPKYEFAQRMFEKCQLASEGIR